VKSEASSAPTVPGKRPFSMLSVEYIALPQGVSSTRTKHTLKDSPQDFTVLKNVAVARHLHGRESLTSIFTGARKKIAHSNNQIASEIVAFMGLEHLEEELAVNLPHGHQRALGVAIALACEPKVLLLDEPLTGMTPTEKAHMIGLIRKVHEKGITILMVEHDMKSVMELCDYISVLDFGTLLVEGKPAEIQNNENVINAYLGTEDMFSGHISS